MVTSSWVESAARDIYRARAQAEERAMIAGLQAGLGWPVIVMVEADFRTMLVLVDGQVVARLAQRDVDLADLPVDPFVRGLYIADLVRDQWPGLGPIRPLGGAHE